MNDTKFEVINRNGVEIIITNNEKKLETYTMVGTGKAYKLPVRRKGKLSPVE